MALKKPRSKTVKRVLWVVLLLFLAACQPTTIPVGRTLCDTETNELLVVTRNAEYKDVQESEAIHVIRLNKKCPPIADKPAP